MKAKAALFLITSALLMPATFSASAIQDNVLLSVCNYAAQNDKPRLRGAIKKTGVRLRKFYNDFQCNGQTLLRFALSKDADDAAVYIVKQLSKKQLVAPEADGKTILEWAESNGKGATQAVATIKERVN